MAEREKKSVGRILRKIATRTGIIILGIVLLLVAARIAAPYIIKSQVNKKLASLPEYDGHITDVDLHVYRGAYSIKGLEVTKKNGAVPVPFFSADYIDFSVEWKALLHGALVTTIAVGHPELNFVQGKSRKDSQTGVDKSWQETIKDLAPFRINSFRIIDGEVHFRSFTSKPDINIFMHNLDILATNLTNSEKVAESMVAHVTADGLVMGDGQFKAHMDIDPFQPKPTFTMAAELTHVSLPKLNQFLLAYGKFDVERGFFSLYMECKASEGKFDGYLKPLLENLKVVSWNKDKKDPAKLLWESIVGAVTGLFKNKPEDRLATKIPISGSFDDPNPDIWATIGNLLRNAFVRAIMPGLDRDVRVQAGK
jgi:hypothetical protein